MNNNFAFSLFTSALAISLIIEPAHSNFFDNETTLKTPLIKHPHGRVKELEQSPRSVFDVFSLKVSNKSSENKQTTPSLASRKPQRQLAAILQSSSHISEEKPLQHFSTVVSNPLQPYTIPEVIAQVLPLKSILRSPGQKSSPKGVKFNERDNVDFYFHNTEAPINSLEKSVLPGRVKHVKNGGTSIAHRDDVFTPSKSAEKLNPFIQASFKEYMTAVHENNVTMIDNAKRKINMGAHWGHSGAQCFRATELKEQRKLTEALEWAAKAKKDPKNRLALNLHRKLVARLETQYNHALLQSTTYKQYTDNQQLKEPCVPSKVPVAFPWKYKVDGKTYSTLNGGLRSLYNQAVQLLSDDSMNPEAYEKLATLTSKGISKWLRSAAHFRLYEFEKKQGNSVASTNHLKAAAKLGLKTAQYLHGKNLVETGNATKARIGVKYLNNALLQNYWPAGDILTKHFKEKVSKLGTVLRTYGQLPVTTKKGVTKKY